ncbi:MAG TPA: NAD(P)-dependent oxidoreductase [Arenibacter sp.]|nr:NAD(P)-dependent oxidoreductase [Arenibacter sp.]|tara:strand:- start:3532 stop:4419 length:888 start_codon:yes stop_codon:yes gene_type:complete
MKKTLITGATGGLGSNVVNFLKEKTGVENIAVLVRDENSALSKQYANEGIEVRIGDYNNLESLENAFTGIQTLYFVSGSDVKNRLQQHKNVIDTAKKSGINHILYTSTVRKNESDSAPLASVVGSHKQTEDWIKASEITYTILRHNLYAEVINMFIGDKDQLLQTKAVYLPTGNGLTAFVPRKDFAEAEATILSNPTNYQNNTLEFNGSEKISFSEIAKKISEIVKEPIAYISPEITEFEAKMNEIGLPKPIIELLSTFSLGIADEEFDQESNDLETVLGRRTISISEYLKSTYK